MDDTEAVRALAALANPHRLAVFRALVRAGGEGLSAGELALTNSPREFSAACQMSSTFLGSRFIVPLAPQLGGFAYGLAVAVAFTS